MNKALLKIVLLGGLALAQTSTADVAITYNVSGGAGEKMTITVAGQKAAMGMKSPQGEAGRIVFDGNSGQLLMVMDDRREYMDMDQMLQGMSGLSDMLSGMMENIPEEAKSQLGGILGGTMNAKPEQPQIINTGNNDTVAGFSCEIIQSNTSVSSTELCLADPGEVGISNADFRTLKGMMEKQQQMAQQASQMFGATNLSFGPMDLNRIPVRSRQLSGPGAGSVAEIFDVSQNIDAAATDVPADYQMVAMPGG